MLNQYRYSISIRYKYQGKEIEFDNTNVHSLLVDYDYDNKNMPIIYITAALDKNIIDDMILNSSNKVLTLYIYKYINNSDLKVKELYISGQFIYFLSNSELNNTQTLDYSKDTSDSKDMFKKVTIGLLKKELIDNNKITINNVIKNSTLSTTLLYYLSSMKLLIEPVNNVNIESFIIPPLNSMTQLIEFLDDNFNIYPDSKYRLFYDFDKTYLLSSKGNNIQSIEDKVHSIIIRIDNTIKEDSKVQGMEIENDTCIINIDANDIHYYEDKVTDKSYTGIMTIDTDGSSSTVGTTDRLKIIRTNNGNVDKGIIEKSHIDNISSIISIVKTELDSSIITMNKIYTIKNYDKLNYNDGNFLLSRKKEVYSSDDGNFILSTLITFPQIIS